MALPEITIRTLSVAHDRCAICDRQWSHGPASVPTAYTVESIRDESVKLPHVVCDRCVEKHYPEEFPELIRDRQRFWGG
jgi:hypothetical protein